MSISVSGPHCVPPPFKATPGASRHMVSKRQDCKDVETTETEHGTIVTEGWEAAE